jgi:hydrogenase maturation protease
MLVIGIGNAWRTDDAAGLAVTDALQASPPPGVEVLAREGEPTELIDVWAGAEAVWLVDAVSSGAPPGTVHRLDASSEPLPAALFRVSSHLVGLAEAIELARALGRLPPRVVVFGIEGAHFEAGEGLSPEVADAVERVAAALCEETEPSRLPAQEAQ